MQKIKYYEIYRTDGCSSRVSMNIAFADAKEAQDFARGKSYFVSQQKELTLYSTVDEYYKDHVEELKKSALNKLSEAEKKALGLI